jgi:hypothetical protein
MTKLKEIDMDILPDEVKKELLDFYEYLLTKYGKKQLLLKDHVKNKKAFFEAVKKHSFKLPKDYKFDREELHER